MYSCLHFPVDSRMLLNWNLFFPDLVDLQSSLLVVNGGNAITATTAQHLTVKGNPEGYNQLIERKEMNVVILLQMFKGIMICYWKVIAMILL